ncbi:MAG: hypothetical protein RL670_384 [Actinomycetota bacterium]
MWIWVFVSIGALGLLWHGILMVRLAGQAKLLAQSAAPAMERLVKLGEESGRRPALVKPALAIETSLDEVVARRMLLLRRRASRKAERERRLLERLKRIDPTERRFTRAKRT